MSLRHDPELDDVLQDRELRHLADLLQSARRPEPPLDDAFRSELRRTLMQKAWEAGEGRAPWWSRLTTPPALAWAGAAVGVILIASVVVFMSQQSGGGELTITSPMADASAVQLQQPILVKFSQPMDHTSTQDAVQISPATYVSYSWQENTMSVQPTSGNLAPNTQYQVTIGPTAKTAAGQLVAAPQTITFVTEPSAPAPPPPPPTATPTPRVQLPGERQLAILPSGTATSLQWSADSSAIYFIGASGALDLVALKASDVKVLVPDGVSSPKIAPAGDRLAYVRGGKIEVLALDSGTTVETTVTPPATSVTWVKDKLFWSSADGIYTQATDRQSKLAPLLPDAAMVSIAPDGTHATYRQSHSLLLLDLATGKTTSLGAADAQFFGWSPDGTRLIYSSADGNVVADSEGKTLSTIPGGDASWSSLDEIILGSDADLYGVRPDAFGLTRLASGTYHAPFWAPNGTAFSFVRGGALWAAAVSPLAPEPPALDLASSAVNSFMKARLAPVQPDQAKTFLTDNGKLAYASDGLNLLITGDRAFSRFYILAQELTGAQPDTARIVVRLVLAQGKLNVADFEETLTLVRDPSTGRFLIDNATAGPRRDLGKGPEVVAVDVAQSVIKVTFDSDLKPGTVPFGVILLNNKGKQVSETATYANRIATLGGLELVRGEHYKLVVFSTVHDWLDHNVASEYDLDLIGPAVIPTSDHSGTGVSPTPKPNPTPTPTPVASSAAP
jgi:Tol biopolymer transport system component